MSPCSLAGPSVDGCCSLPRASRSRPVRRRAPRQPGTRNSRMWWRGAPPCPKPAFPQCRRKVDAGCLARSHGRNSQAPGVSKCLKVPLPSCFLGPDKIPWVRPLRQLTPEDFGGAGRPSAFPVPGGDDRSWGEAAQRADAALHAPCLSDQSPSHHDPHVPDCVARLTRCRCSFQAWDWVVSMSEEALSAQACGPATRPC